MAMKKAALALGALAAGLACAQTATPPQGMKAIPAGEFWMGRVHFFLVDAVGWFERERGTGVREWKNRK